VYRRTIAGFEVLLCKVVRPLYSSRQKPAVQNLRGFGFVSAGGFNLSHLQFSSSVPTLNVVCHMCNDEQQCNCTLDYMNLHAAAPPSRYMGSRAGSATADLAV
jgi:hypothetical protein